MRQIQIAVRVPEEVVLALDQLTMNRRNRLAVLGKWSVANSVNRSTILREALESGLAILNEREPANEGLPTDTVVHYCV